MSDRVTLRLSNLKNTVESFRLNRGLNISEAIRFIIDDYFKAQHRATFEKSNPSELNQLKEDMEQLKKDMEELKFNTDVALKMLLVIGNTDDELRPEFMKYFPRYFK